MLRVSPPLTTLGDSMNRAPAIDYNLIFNLGAESSLERAGLAEKKQLKPTIKIPDSREMSRHVSSLSTGSSDTASVGSPGWRWQCVLFASALLILVGLGRCVD
jgi:hypothetical protein